MSYCSNFAKKSACGFLIATSGEVTNSMEVKRKIGGSVKPEVEYLMIEKLKDKNKNAQWFVLFCIVYLESINALVHKL